MTLEYVNHIPWDPQTKWECLFIIHTFMLNLDMGGVILLALCARINVHLGIIPWNYYHSHTIIQNTDTIHNILINQIGTIHYSYRYELLLISKFLPRNVR